MPFTNPIIAGTTLVREAIKSPDYVPGVSGWSINRDGTVEFANADVRGSLSTGSPGEGQWYIGSGDPLASFLSDSAIVGRWATSKAFVLGTTAVAGKGLLRLFGIVNDTAGLSKFMEVGYDESADQDYLTLSAGDRNASDVKVDLSNDTATVTGKLSVSGIVQLLSGLTVTGVAQFLAGLTLGSNGWQVLAGQRGNITTGPAANATSFLVTNVPFPKPFPAGVIPHVTINRTMSPSGAATWVTQCINVTNTKFDIIGAGPAVASGFNVVHTWSAVVHGSEVV